MAGAARKIESLEGIVFAIHTAANETQDDVRRILRALKAVAPGETSEDEPDEHEGGEGARGLPIPIGAPREPEGGDGESDAGEATEAGGMTADDNEGATGLATGRNQSTGQDREAEAETPEEASTEAPASPDVKGMIKRTAEVARGRNGLLESQDRVEAAKEAGRRLLEEYRDELAGRKLTYRKATFKSVNGFIDRKKGHNGEALLEFVDQLREAQYVSASWLDTLIGRSVALSLSRYGQRKGDQTIPRTYEEASRAVTIRRQTNKHVPRKASEEQEEILVDLTKDENHPERTTPCTAIVARRPEIESGETRTSVTEHRAKRTKLSTIEETTEEQSANTPRDGPPEQETTYQTRRFTPVKQGIRYQTSRDGRNRG